MPTPDLLAQPLSLPCGAMLANRLCKAAMTEGLADTQLREDEILDFIARLAEVASIARECRFTGMQVHGAQWLLVAGQPGAAWAVSRYRQLPHPGSQQRKGPAEEIGAAEVARLQRQVQPRGTRRRGGVAPGHARVDLRPDAQLRDAQGLHARARGLAAGDDELAHACFDEAKRNA